MTEVKTVEGYTNGYKFDDFKKGDTVYVFYSATAVKGSEVLREGKVVELVRAKNAKGVDCIRQVVIDLGGLHYMVSGPRYIKEKIYTKDEVVAPEVQEIPEVQKAQEIKEAAATFTGDQEAVESKWIERAMGPKNKEVKKYLEMGWTFKEKVWDAEKNMYLSLVVKEG
ncbi:hypothetical protein [Peribacillus asahii]|uniref:hypothetical protein n=1 Tax=Peribacillus asahii TaxID=228899 RepID=UPI002079C4C8|nr:hypothetical protein [Peribacillus asahii]USK72620.1 hypothetical protein LIS76_23535 [Peribacillus asahii]USK72736.1 hypothetical protein LIS76_23715 [Peribacillus asahii]